MDDFRTFWTEHPRLSSLELISFFLQHEAAKSGHQIERKAKIFIIHHVQVESDVSPAQTGPVPQVFVPTHFALS